MLRDGPVDGGVEGGNAGGTTAAVAGGVGSGGRTRPREREGAGAAADGGVGDGSGATAGGGTGSARTSTRVEDGAAAPSGLPGRRELAEVQAPRATTASTSQARDRELVIALSSRAAPEQGRFGAGRRRTDDRGLGRGRDLHGRRRLRSHAARGCCRR